MKIGLLPFYLMLYDETCQFMRPKVESFNDIIKDKLSDMGFEVICAPICRIKPEFDSAVESLENSGAVVIITLHLAYSQSLESIDALINTRLPILVLDTTESF